MLSGRSVSSRFAIMALGLLLSVGFVVASHPRRGTPRAPSGPPASVAQALPGVTPADLVRDDFSRRVIPKDDAPAASPGEPEGANLLPRESDG